MISLAQGVNLYNQKRYKEALNFFLSVMANEDDGEVEPSKAWRMELSYYLGLCYERTGQSEDALEYLEDVVNDSDTTEARRQQCMFILAVIYAKTNRTNLATYELNKLIDSGYKIANVYSALAFIAYENFDIDKCKEYYEMALSESSDCSTALNGLGYVLSEDGGNLSKALSYCKKATELSPSFATFDSLGWVYHKLGMESEAHAQLSKALMLCPPSETKSRTQIKQHLQQVADNERGDVDG